MQENVNMKKIIDGAGMKKEDIELHTKTISSLPDNPKVIQALSEEEIQRAHELLHKDDK